MCGLAGIVMTRGESGEELGRAAGDMARALTHRGPDGDGIWVDAHVGVALAHRRLAVIDLSPRGAQPMVSEDGRFVLAFNGEIYNYLDMAKRLAARGAVLRGQSDTEVLLETIASTSLASTLDEANGMFALALWDRQKRTMTLARDRLGEKPLYYAPIPGGVLFASELSALERHPCFNPAISRESVALFLRHSFIPSPHTIYEDVYKLPAGSTLTIDSSAGLQAGPVPFWSLQKVAVEGRANVGEVADAVALEEIEALLQDSVRLRLVSDVPVGAFLSGGIDSSLVVALMQQTSSQPVRTFTISVGGRHDEGGHAAAVARHLGTEHTQIDLPERDALSLATQIPTVYDEPFGDPSAIPTALMSTTAREWVTVCLSGDGGDEVMAGYNRYRAAGPAFDAICSVPRPVRRAAAKGLLAVAPHVWDTLGARLPGTLRTPDVGNKLHKLARLLTEDSGLDRYRSLVTVLDPSTVMVGDGPELLGKLAEPVREHLDALHLMLYLDGLVTLPDDMLVKVDRASMATSLECRVPLLDHRLVELAWRLPTRVKIRDGQAKWAMREILGKHVPVGLFDRPKQGFDPPIGRWLQGPLRPWAGELLAEGRLRRQGLLDPASVQRLWHEHDVGRQDHAYALWALVVLQAWLDRSGRP